MNNNNDMNACALLKNKLIQIKPELEEWVEKVYKEEEIVYKKLELALQVLRMYADNDNYDTVGAFDTHFNGRRYYLGALAEETLKGIDNGSLLQND